MSNSGLNHGRLQVRFTARHSRSLLAACMVFPSVLSCPALAETAADRIVVKAHPVPVSVPAEGVIEAVKQANISAQVPGRVVEIRVEAGQAIKKGDVLLRLDVREASEALAASEAQWINAKANYERTHRLVEQKFMSSAVLDKAKADLDAATAQRNAARAGQSHGVIVAPFNGWVATRPANLGDQAMPGTPLVTVYDPSGLKAVAQVPQYRIGQLKPVKQARVEVTDVQGKIRMVESVAVTVVPSADASTHATQVRVDLPSGTTDIVPGSYARIHFVTGTANKLTVPAGAVVRRGEVAAVYVQPSGNPAQPVLRQLRLGEMLANGEVEVLAGLVEGEQVLTDPVATAMSLKAARKP